ncbi:MAG TPA: GTP-binding protein [Puia sp.]|nr:GTP-binding protein [Puia sp.]
MIRKGSLVTMRYTMRNGRGEMLENRQTTYLHGSSEISPVLQTQLEGLEPGQTKMAYLKKGDEDADDDFTFEIVIEAVRQAMQIHLLSGFLGSGKTTAISQACRLLATYGIPSAVISNDQGDQLVDGAFFEHLGIPGRQVTNGCFCCNYNDLDRCILSLTGQDQYPILFAESVGSCTDLVATVLKPLSRQYRGWHPTVSVFADAMLLPGMLEGRSRFDPAVNYIYMKQLEEAQVIVVTKTDQAGNDNALRRLLTQRFPEKTVLHQNSFNDDHILRWLQTLGQLSPGSATLPSLDIDYDRYGAGEAQLAWLDQQLEIESPSQNAQWAALALVTRLSRTNHPIGHLKCLIDNTVKISFTSTDTTGFTSTGTTDFTSTDFAHFTTGTTDHIPIRPAASTRLLINARIQTSPVELSALIAEAIQATEKAHHCTIRTLTASCFQPGFPRPTHRLS